MRGLVAEMEACSPAQASVTAPLAEYLFPALVSHDVMLYLLGNHICVWAVGACGAVTRDGPDPLDEEDPGISDQRRSARVAFARWFRPSPPLVSYGI
jgi:hypothetical protein